ncbi:MAG: DUF58 domain-containing protein [Candidatus Thermoplasmatota archaeon]|nr:DUF58 domain-containing protein [Candidatus Thermoplasmatota archaeon]
MIKEWARTLLVSVFIVGVIAVTAFLSSSFALLIAVIFPMILLITLRPEGSNPSVSVTCDTELIRTEVRKEFDINFNLDLRGPPGIFVLEFPYSSHCSVTTGSNVHVTFCNGSETHRKVTYGVYFLRRGTYPFASVRYKFYPVSGSVKILEGDVPIGLTVEVAPIVRTMQVRLVNLRTEKALPRSIRSVIGPASDEFESIRQYQPGDPYRNINWKATARSASAGNIMVNRYYSEGYESTMVLMDAGFFVQQGSSDENAFEYSVSYALSLSKVLLDYNQEVGISLANPTSRGTQYVLPFSTDPLQFARQLRFFTSSMGEQWHQVDYGLDHDAIVAIKKHYPYVIVTTSLSRLNYAKVVALERSLSPISKKVIVVDILTFGLAARVAGLRPGRTYMENIVLESKKTIHTRVAAYGRLIVWEPVSESIGDIVYRTLREMRM